MKLDAIVSYDEWRDEYGFDLWGRFGEQHEVFFDDPHLAEYLAAGRVVSLVDYDCDCDDECWCDTDYVIEGWARVDVIRRVVLPEGWTV